MIKETNRCRKGENGFFYLWKTVERIENERQGLMVTFQGGEESVVFFSGCYAILFNIFISWF